MAWGTGPDGAEILRGCEPRPLADAGDARALADHAGCREISVIADGSDFAARLITATGRRIAGCKQPSEASAIVGALLAALAADG